ncbi:MAG: 1-acyl-sn-glycerol-3-phosphate acyltransferase [Bacteroidota bacterium]|nr:1-acyl-sn-glycerol-3-phosphate acyltransferase [Bacteroidota bacterium]
MEIDLRKVINDKNPKLLKLIPRFIISYLERVIHIKELNRFLKENKEKEGLEFVGAVLEEFGVDIECCGLDNIPKEGRFIFVSNHPLGGLDGLALMYIIGKLRPDVVFPVNDLLMAVPNLQSLFIPINKHGSNAQNIKIIDNTFAGDDTMLYFPAGLCSRKQSGKIYDLEWKKTFVSKARKHKRDVIPIHVKARNSNFFYNLANIRKFFGIKANIEMLYLVDEMFKQRNKKMVITIGKPIEYSFFDRSVQNDRKWATYVKNIVYKLEK